MRNKSQREFRKEMKRLQQEKPDYFQHHNTYNKRSKSMKRKVTKGIGVFAGGIIVIRLCLLLVGYIIPWVNPELGQKIHEPVSMLNHEEKIVDSSIQVYEEYTIEDKEEVVNEINAMMTIVNDYLYKESDAETSLDALLQLDIYYVLDTKDYLLNTFSHDIAEGKEITGLEQDLKVIIYNEAMIFGIQMDYTDGNLTYSYE